MSLEREVLRNPDDVDGVRHWAVQLLYGMAVASRRRDRADAGRASLPEVLDAAEPSRSVQRDVFVCDAARVGRRITDFRRHHATGTGYSCWKAGGRARHPWGVLSDCSPAPGEMAERSRKELAASRPRGWAGSAGRSLNCLRCSCALLRCVTGGSGS